MQHDAIILASNTDAGDIQARLVLQPSHPFTVRVSKGIERDIQEAIQQRVRRHCVFTGQVTSQYFTTKAKTLGQTLSVLTGYDHPPELVAGMARNRLERLWQEYTSCALPSSLMHDPDQRLVDVHEDYAHVAQLDETTPRRKIDAAPSEPPIGAVQDHIEFLARTDAKILVQMHDFLAAHPSQPLFAFWRAQIERDDVGLGYRSLKMLALEQLATLEDNFIRGAKG
ncbi:hypothetical protein GF380_06410 [Candidatus Uhrbacteria bacterium]|nr:hypothetical protein [Candidatus Uhrbacteria bacterium]